MKKVLYAIVLFIVGMLCFRQNVMAAGAATVTVKGDILNENSTDWKVTCVISGDAKITNGKVRVTYDGSKLKLVSSASGSLISNALPSINDPLTGNKQEGEVVLVFASSSEMDANGELLQLTFQAVSGQLKNGDAITVSAATEELADNTENISVTDVPLNVTVGSSTDHTSGTGTGNGSNTASTEPQTNSSGNSSGAESQTNAGIESPETSANAGTAGTSQGSSTSGTTTGSQTSGNSSSSVSSTQSETTQTVRSAKTGDDTNILRPLIIAVIALLVLAGGFMWSKKKK